MEKKVKIKMPLSRNEKDDVYVGVNGKSWVIQRGQEVEVPWYVARVLERQEMMLSEAIRFEVEASRPLQELENEE